MTNEKRSFIPTDEDLELPEPSPQHVSADWLRELDGITSVEDDGPPREPVIDPDKREEFLSDMVEILLDGSYYVTYYKSGKSQVNLDAAATKAFTRLHALISLERDE